MSEAVWKNCKFYLGPYDFSGSFNALAIDYKIEAPDKTAMGDTAKTFLPGLADVSIAHNGWWTANAAIPGFPETQGWADSALFPRIGATVLPITMAQTGSIGEPCFMFQPLFNGYTPGAKTGDVFAFGIKAEGTGPLVQGTIMVPKSTESASDNGTARQLGAVTSTQTLYAILHVFIASDSDTLDVIVESDDAEAFLDPTTRITFTQATTYTSEWKSVAGAFTDDWWRVSWTIGGAAPSFTFAVAVGIL